MYKKYTPFLVLVVVALVFIFTLTHNIKIPPGDIHHVKIAGQEISVDVVNTEESREQGLSGRKELKINEGMLFVFDTSAKYRFWMKDMLFPIDMIWINQDMSIVYIKEDAKPESYPEGFGPGASDRDAKYILEVVSGFAKNNNLKVGDEVRFTY